MPFDAEVTVMSAHVGTPNQEALDAGTPPYVELGIEPGLALPFANPATGGPLIVPFGKLRFIFSRQQALDIFRGAVKAAEALPEEPAASEGVMIAHSMTDVAAAAENMKRVTGK